LERVGVRGEDAQQVGPLVVGGRAGAPLLPGPAPQVRAAAALAHVSPAVRLEDLAPVGLMVIVVAGPVEAAPGVRAGPGHVRLPLRADATFDFGEGQERPLAADFAGV